MLTWTTLNNIITEFISELIITKALLYKSDHAAQLLHFQKLQACVGDIRGKHAKQMFWEICTTIVIVCLSEWTIKQFQCIKGELELTRDFSCYYSLLCYVLKIVKQSTDFVLKVHNAKTLCTEYPTVTEHRMHNLYSQNTIFCEMD